MKVSRYDEIARGVNAPIYEYYARKIREETDVIKGVCLDAGSGGGYLGCALAGITYLVFIFLDRSADALERAKAHIAEDGLQNRATTLLADVHDIPLADGSVNLVISRGSIRFWEDPATALQEIYRVLAPGGTAYVGGGRGMPDMQARIREEMARLGIEWSERPEDEGVPGEGEPKRHPHRDYKAILAGTGIHAYRVTRGVDGTWIRLWKLCEPLAE